MSLTITPEGILKTGYPDTDIFHVLKPPSGTDWTMQVSGATGDISTQDAAAGSAEEVVLYDANNTPWQITIDDGGVLTIQSFERNIVLAPVVNAAVLIDGLPAAGYQLLAFQAGTAAGVTTYKNGLFVTTQPVPILLNDFGLPTDPVFIIVGQAYKFQLLTPGGTLVKEWDYVVGGIPLGLSNATEYGQAFAASFRTTVTAAIQGDVRSTFPIGRRLRAQQTFANYQTVKTSTYNGTETILEMEPGGVSLDNTLVSIQPSILSPVGSAFPDRRNLGKSTYFSGALNIAPAQGITVLPVSAIILGLASAIPFGYFRCNGQAVSRTTYANLFAAIGTTYGVGNGTTTFNVPTIADVGTLVYLIYAKG